MLCRFSQALNRGRCIWASIIAHNGTNARWQRRKTALWNPIFIFLSKIFSIQTCVTSALVYTCKRMFQTSARKPRNQCKHQPICVNFLSWGQFWCVNGLKSAHWIGRYLSFHLNWVLGPFIHGRLQDLQTSEVTFCHNITPLAVVPYTACYIELILSLYVSTRTGESTRILIQTSDTLAPLLQAVKWIDEAQARLAELKATEDDLLNQREQLRHKLISLGNYSTVLSRVA